MKETTVIMTMPVAVEIVDASARQEDIVALFDYFRSVEDRFSRFKPESEISQINAGILARQEASAEMRDVFDRAERTKRDTAGYFDITRPDGTLDVSGLVKGLAVHQAACMLDNKGYQHFSVEIGGDIEVRGHNEQGAPWRIGIRHPFQEGIVKVVHLSDKGIATSGTYERGAHIYNPHTGDQTRSEVVSTTVIGPNVYEADRFATAVFAMGTEGAAFIESLPGFEAYQIDAQGIATFTSGFLRLYCT